MNALSRVETRDLAECEAVNERGLATCPIAEGRFDFGNDHKNSMV